jgi:nitrite reductase/ring-hydroxylating ferredoxin subunit
MIDVGGLDDFPPRSVTVVPAGRVEIGVVRWDGDAVYALRNLCPHARGPVCAGRLGPKIVASGADPLGLDVDEASPVIACAWHGWEFDVRTGQALWAGSRYRVRTYPVTVEAGRVLVETGGRR